MESNKLTHVSTEGNPQMVDVSDKAITKRTARAQALIDVGETILAQINDNNELITKKGAVFQTAIIAGVMGAKNTSALIPFCHPLSLDDCQVSIQVVDKKIVVSSSATVTARTGVEMEALTAASVAALTIYDMCKAISHDLSLIHI